MRELPRHGFYRWADGPDCVHRPAYAVAYAVAYAIAYAFADTRADGCSYSFANAGGIGVCGGPELSTGLVLRCDGAGRGRERGRYVHAVRAGQVQR